MPARRITGAILVALLGIAALAPGLADAAGAKARPTCELFLKKKSIVDIVKEEVVLTKPNPGGGGRQAPFVLP